MTPTRATSLLGVFEQLTDPRDPRGVRHPFAGLLAIVFLGLLSRQPDFANIARWAKRHWAVLKPAFGLTYPRGPHATTYSRAAALFSVDEFRTALDRQTRRRSGAVTVQTRYFATSLNPASVSAVGLLRLIRGHWCVENNLHYEKDRWWDEDRHSRRRPGLAVRFTALLSAAVSGLQVLKPGEADEPLKARADALNWDIDRAVKLLTR